MSSYHKHVTEPATRAISNNGYPGSDLTDPDIAQNDVHETAYHDVWHLPPPSTLRHLLSVMTYRQSGDSVDLHLGPGLLIRLQPGDMTMELGQGRISLGNVGNLVTMGTTGGKLRQLATLGKHVSCLVVNDEGDYFQVDVETGDGQRGGCTFIQTVVCHRLDHGRYALETVTVSDMQTGKPTIQRRSAGHQLSRALYDRDEQPVLLGDRLFGA